MGERFFGLLEDLTSCGGALLRAFGRFYVLWGSTFWSFWRIQGPVGERFLALLEDLSPVGERFLGFSEDFTSCGERFLGFSEDLTFCGGALF